MRVRVLSAEFQRKPPSPKLDLSRLTSFLMFFGVSGGEHARRQKLARDFQRFYYPYLATLLVQLPDGAELALGAYTLEGADAQTDLNARGWTVLAYDLTRRTATLSSELSEAAQAEVQGWRGRDLVLRPKP